MHTTRITSMRHLTMLLRQGQSRVSQVEQPEGNGTGFIWDQEGHIITNYHVIGSALQQVSKRPGSSTPKVARVTLLGKHTNAGRRACERHVCELSERLSLEFSPAVKMQPPSCRRAVGLQVQMASRRPLTAIWWGPTGPRTSQS